MSHRALVLLAASGLFVGSALVNRLTLVSEGHQPCQVTLIEFDKTLDQIGVVPPGTSVSAVFRCFNRAKHSVSLKHVAGGCGCISVVAEREYLHPDESTIITVKYSPGVQREHRRFLQTVEVIWIGQGSESRTSLAIEGEVVPPVLPFPDVLILNLSPSTNLFEGDLRIQRGSLNLERFRMVRCTTEHSLRVIELEHTAESILYHVAVSQDIVLSDSEYLSVAYSERLSGVEETIVIPVHVNYRSAVRLRPRKHIAVTRASMAAPPARFELAGPNRGSLRIISVVKVSGGDVFFARNVDNTAEFPSFELASSPPKDLRAGSVHKAVFSVNCKDLRNGKMLQIALPAMLFVSPPKLD